MVEPSPSDVVMRVVAFRGDVTVLTKQCVEYHTGPARDKKDAEVRQLSIRHIRKTLEKPQFILVDKDADDRYDYVKAIIDDDISDTPHVMFVAVDRATKPHSIATWGPRRSFKGIKHSRGVIYDADNDD